MDLIKTLIIFLLVLGAGYYGFNYYKESKGFGFKMVEATYNVRVGVEAYNSSKLKMHKDGKYELEFCGLTSGQYEIIDGIYNFKVGQQELDTTLAYECNQDDKRIYTSLRGKYRTTMTEDGALKIWNDNDDYFYLYKVDNPQ